MKLIIVFEGDETTEEHQLAYDTLGYYDVRGGDVENIELLNPPPLPEFAGYTVLTKIKLTYE